jgi:hypothetical protein
VDLAIRLLETVHVYHLSVNYTLQSVSAYLTIETAGVLRRHEVIVRAFRIVTTTYCQPLPSLKELERPANFHRMPHSAGQFAPSGDQSRHPAIACIRTAQR